MKTPNWRLLLFGFATLVLGCGGGSSGDKNGENQPGNAFYHFYLGANQRLFAVDPTRPGLGSREVLADGTSLRVAKYIWLRNAKYVNDALSEIHYPWVIVFSESAPGIGTPYRVNALVRSGAPVATKLAGLEGVEICGQDTVSDFADPNHSVYLIRILERTVPADDCDVISKTSWKVVRMDALGSPLPANKVIEGIRSETGAILGYLVKKGANGILQLVDLEFKTIMTVYGKNPVGDIQFISLGTPVKMTPNINGVYLFSTDNKDKPFVYGYDSVQAKLTNQGLPLYSFVSTQSAVSFLDINTQSEGWRYFVDSDANGDFIVRLAKSGTAAATIAVSGIASRVRKMAVSEHALMYVNGDGKLFQVALASDVAVVEGSLTAVASSGVVNLFTSGPWVFYSTAASFNPAAQPPFVAHFIRDDGTGYGKFDGQYAASPSNNIGALWSDPLYLPERSDDLPFAKGDMVLFMADSDSKNGFHRVVPGSGVASASAFQLDSHFELRPDNFEGDNFEGDHALVAVMGGAGSVHIIDTANGSSVRVDDQIQDNGDEAYLTAGENPFSILKLNR